MALLVSLVAFTSAIENRPIENSAGQFDPIRLAHAVRSTPVPSARVLAAHIAPNPPQRAPVPVSGVISLGREMAAAAPYNWTGGQWDALYDLWDHESGWSTSSTNGSSGACGIPQRHPCQGLSSLPAAQQIAWGLAYIKGRYGSPIGALGHWSAYNWY